MGTGVGPRDASLRREFGALTLKAMIEAGRDIENKHQLIRTVEYSQDVTHLLQHEPYQRLLAGRLRPLK